MFNVVRAAASAVVFATIVTASVQPSSAAPLPQTEARVWCVDLAGGATGAPCTNPDAYPTIQAAVDAAQSGDEIRIAQGVYTGTYTGMDDPKQYSVVVIPGISLKLVGGFASGNWTTPDAANKTVIDGQDQVRGITAWNGKIALEHLTLTRGKAPATNPSNNYPCSSNVSCGGAIFGYNSNVSLQKAVISDNHAASHGGGISASTVAMTDTQIINNRAEGDGGGIVAGEVQMLRSIVANNHARGTITYSLGGGVFSSKFKATDSVIATNTATDGGGVATGTPLINRTRIEYNHARRDGGGLYLEGPGSDADSKITNSVISNNTASGNGGGVYNTYGTEIRNTTIDQNKASKQGGGLYVDSGLTEIVGTMMRNNAADIGGAAIHVAHTGTSAAAGAYLYNTTVASVARTPHEAILADDKAAFVGLFDSVITNYAVGVALAEGAELRGNYNAFFNNGVDQTVDGSAQPLPFANLIISDPRFVDPAAGDFHLQPSSPLIDRGDLDRGYLQDQRDIDGDAVPYGGRADIGADEWVGTYRTWAPVVAK